MGKLVKFFSVAVLALSPALATVTLLNSNVYAAASGFTVETAKVTAKSDGVEAEISKLDDSTIQSNTRLNQLGDSAEYTLTLKNATGYKLIIDSVSIVNENEYIEFSYDDYAGMELAADDSFDFVLRASYANVISDSNARSQSLNAKISISYTDERSNEGVAEITVSPNTSDNILGILGIFAASVLALVATILFTRRKLAHGKLFCAIAAVAALGVLIPSVASANDNLSEIWFTSNFELYSKIRILVNDGTEVRREEVDYGFVIGDNLDDAEVPGYIFQGWKNEDGSDFDVNSPITNDVSIHPELTPINYIIAIDTDGDGDVDTNIDAVYDQDVTLPTNSAIKPGHTSNGWTDGTNHYDDNETVSNLTVNNGDVINLAPDWIQTQRFIRFSANGGSGSIDGFYVTAGEEITLPANGYTRKNYTFLGWSLSSNSSMPSYVEGQKIVVPEESNDELVVYAIWGEGVWHKITYVGNMTPEEIASANNPLVFKENHTTSNWIYLNKPTRKGYSFGWTGGMCTTTCTNAPVYGDHDLVYSGNFKPIQYLIVYEKNGDGVKGSMANHQISYDESEALRANAYTRKGYIFKGWARQADGEVKYADQQIVKNLSATGGATIRLYAVWEEE